jgi:hypothetical protein
MATCPSDKTATTQSVRKKIPQRLERGNSFIYVSRSIVHSGTLLFLTMPIIKRIGFWIKNYAVDARKDKVSLIQNWKFNICLQNRTHQINCVNMLKTSQANKPGEMFIFHQGDVYFSSNLMEAELMQ